MKNSRSSHTKGRSVLPTTKVVAYQQPIYIPLFFADSNPKRQILWQLELDNGIRDSGKVKRNAINLAGNLPIGTHLLNVIVGKDVLCENHSIYQCQLIVE
ncbi:hypothetical protein BMT54_03275 [Pasteurellaceae bacterium 15-036681]|nr:hypothetical protein BMT54_03275 [Pasteurellaceae bacterium 15-036681]